MVKQTKIVQIGNSRGVRIPKALLTKYDLQDEVVLEELEDGVELPRFSGQFRADSIL